MRVTVAITGASGAIYALRLLQALGRCVDVERIYVVMSRSGRAVWRHEQPDVVVESLSAKIEMIDVDNLFVGIASGSNAADAMVVVPSSMGSVARIAGGVSSNLIERAADVQLKERKPLVVVWRETPLSLIHLRNLSALAEAGAVVMPASPSFYSGAATVVELVDTVVERILDKMGVQNDKKYRFDSQTEK